MKNILLFSAALLTAGITMAQNGAHLEYKISSSKGYTGSMNISISEYGSLSEFNMVIPQMPGGGISNKSLVQSGNAETVYMINDKNKSYSEMKRQDAEKDDTKTYEVKKLGNETVNGYKCTHALVTQGSETNEVWNTKDIAEFEKYSKLVAANKRMGSQKQEQALKTAGCDGVPVKSLSKGNEREGDISMELVKLEKKSFSRSDFELPAGYTKGGSGAAPGLTSPVKSQQEMMSMTPEERAKYIEDLKAQRGAH